MLPLIVTGTPWSEPSASFRVIAESAFLACTLAPSASRFANARSFGSSMEIRSRVVSTSSVVEIARVRMAAVVSEIVEKGEKFIDFAW
jgi:hypothetical protein